MKLLILIGMFLTHMGKISAFVLVSLIVCMLPAIIGLTIGAMLDSLTLALIGAVVNVPWILAVTSFDWYEASNKVERIMSRRMNPDD